MLFFLSAESQECLMADNKNGEFPFCLPIYMEKLLTLCRKKIRVLGENKGEKEEKKGRK